MPENNRNLPLGSLRAFVTLLVVAHHAVLAYHPYAPPPASSLTAPPMLWMAFPVVDSQRSEWVSLFVGFNETFFMSLMFLISGVFAWPSLARKGAASFARDRALRLGLPFLVAAGVLAPLAYYPSYLQAGTSGGAFWHQWLKLGVWPAGPAWFLWVLLAFGCVAAAAYRLVPSFGKSIGRLAGKLGGSPVAFFTVLAGLSAIVYLPMAAAFTPDRWVSSGPFFVQISRVLHYGLYFVAGMGLGAHGLDRGLLAPDGKLARRWPLWVLASLAAFAIAVVTVLTIFSTLAKGGPSIGLGTFGNFTFVLSCAASSFALLALFLRFARTARRAWESLSANAYGIYLLHYACVSWLQLGLLPAQLSASAKAGIVFAGATTLSWVISATLRRTPRLSRLIWSR